MAFKQSEIDRDALQPMAEELLETMNASRTTIRLDVPEDNPYFPVQAEATVSGTRSIMNETNEGLLTAPTFLFVKNNKTLLAQEDVETSPPAFPELVPIYGIRAQLLSPVLEDDELVGLISVHHAGEPRKWTEDDHTKLKRFTARVHEQLGLAIPPLYAE